MADSLQGEKKAILSYIRGQQPMASLSEATCMGIQEDAGELTLH